MQSSTHTVSAGATVTSQCIARDSIVSGRIGKVPFLRDELVSDVQVGGKPSLRTHSTPPSARLSAVEAARPALLSSRRGQRHMPAGPLVGPVHVHLTGAVLDPDDHLAGLKSAPQDSHRGGGTSSYPRCVLRSSAIGRSTPPLVDPPGAGTCYFKYFKF